jgi:hypothetical protein
MVERGTSAFSRRHRLYLLGVPLLPFGAYDGRCRGRWAAVGHSTTCVRRGATPVTLAAASAGDALVVRRGRGSWMGNEWGFTGPL